MPPKKSKAQRDAEKEKAGERDASPVRSKSPEKDKESAPVVVIFFEIRAPDRRTAMYFMEPDDYTKQEIKMLYDWSASDNIFQHFLIENEACLPKPGEATDRRFNNLGHVRTLKEAAPHIAFFNRLEEMPPIYDNMEFDNSNVRIFHIRGQPEYDIYDSDDEEKE